MPAGVGSVRERTTISLSYGKAPTIRGGRGRRLVLQYVKSLPALDDCGRNVTSDILEHSRVPYAN